MVSQALRKFLYFPSVVRRGMKLKIITKTLVMLLVLVAVMPFESHADTQNCKDALTIAYSVPLIPSLYEDRGSPPSVKISSVYSDKWNYNDPIGNSSSFFYVTIKD